MKAIYSPGPSYTDPHVREYAGWVGIMDLMKLALEDAGYEVFIPQVDPKMLDGSSTVSKITSWDLMAADQLPIDADLFLGPPGYSLAQMMRLRAGAHDFIDPQDPYRERQHFRTRIATFVWNNADWWRDKMLAEEYARYNGRYDLSPTWRWINRRALELSDLVIACSPWV